MINPLFALFGGLGFLLVLALLFWPESGLFWRFQNRRELTEKVLIEDTLKKCERGGKTVSLESLAGMLSITQGHVSEILTLTQERGLVGLIDNSFHLTETGKKTATQIIRAHRLWER